MVLDIYALKLGVFHSLAEEEPVVVVRRDTVELPKFLSPGSPYGLFPLNISYRYYPHPSSF